MTFHVILNWLATTKSFQRWLRKKHMLTWVQSPPFLVCGLDVLLKSLYSWFAKFMWTINNVNTTVILPFVHGWNFKLCTAQKKKTLHLWSSPNNLPSFVFVNLDQTNIYIPKTNSLKPTQLNSTPPSCQTLRKPKFHQNFWVPKMQVRSLIRFL